MPVVHVGVRTSYVALRACAIPALLLLLNGREAGHVLLHGPEKRDSAELYLEEQAAGRSDFGGIEAILGRSFGGSATSWPDVDGCRSR